MLNYWLYRFKYRYAQYLPLKVPVDVSLELAAYCTNKCGYCYHSDQKNLPFKKGFMDTHLAYKIIKESWEIGVHSLKFNYRGESTMHPDFERITAYAKQLARGLTFIDRVTNSNFNFRIDREDIFRGLCNQTKVKVSFDSFRKEIFEKQRQGSRYESTLQNIDKFYNYPGRDNTLVVQAVRTNLNADEDLEHEIKSRWPEAIASIRDCVEGRVNKDLSQVVTKKRDDSKRQSCIQAHARLMIRHDGSTGVCCPDISGVLNAGNAKHMSVKELFNSGGATHYRKQLKEGIAFDLDPCKSCSSFESYRGYKHPWNS